MFFTDVNVVTYNLNYAVIVVSLGFLDIFVQLVCFVQKNKMLKLLILLHFYPLNNRYFRLFNHFLIWRESMKSMANIEKVFLYMRVTYAKKNQMTYF